MCAPEKNHEDVKEPRRSRTDDTKESRLRLRVLRCTPRCVLLHRTKLSCASNRNIWVRVRSKSACDTRPSTTGAMPLREISFELFLLLISASVFVDHADKYHRPSSFLSPESSICEAFLDFRRRRTSESKFVMLLRSSSTIGSRSLLRILSYSNRKSSIYYTSNWENWHVKARG